MMNKESQAPSSWKRWGKKLLISAALLLAIVVAAVPWILGSTGLRDLLVEKLIDNPAIKVTTSKASVGYFSAFSIDGLEIDADDGAALVKFERIEAEKSWPGMLIDRPELGTFTFVRPSFDVTVSEKVKPEEPKAPQESVMLPVLTADIQQASVKVRNSKDGKTAVDLDGIDVTFHLKRDEVGSIFEIDPVTIFDHEELTPELCDKGLQLVAPLLGNEIGADGEFSFRIDKFKLPVGDAIMEDQTRRIEIEGAVKLHRAEVMLKETAIAKVVELVSTLLGEPLPKALTIANESEIKFHLANGQVHHEGFALLLPYRNSNVQLKSSGFVDLEGKLDVILSMQLPASELGGSEFAKLLGKDPIKVSISGNVDDPKVQLVTEKDWSERLTGLLARDTYVSPEESGAGDNVGENEDKTMSDETGATSDIALKIAERVAGQLKERRKRVKESKNAIDEREEDDERLLPNLRERRQKRRERRNRNNG